MLCNFFLIKSHENNRMFHQESHTPIPKPNNVNKYSAFLSNACKDCGTVLFSVMSVHRDFLAHGALGATPMMQWDKTHPRYEGGLPRKD